MKTQNIKKESAADRKRINFGLFYCVLFSFIVIMTFVQPAGELTVEISGATEPGYMEFNRTDETGLEPYYADSIDIEEGDSAVRIADYPIKRTNNIDLSLAGAPGAHINKARFSLLGLVVRTYDSEEIDRYTVEGENSVSLPADRALTVRSFSLFFLFAVLFSLVCGLALNTLQRKLKFHADTDNDAFSALNGFIVVTASGLVSYLFGEFLNRGMGFIDWKHLIINYMLICAVFLVLTALGGIVFGVCAGELLTTLFYVLNYYTVQFRGRSILPWDVFGINTAAAVAKTYSFEITFFVIALIAVDAVVMAAAFFYSRNTERRLAVRYRIAAALLGAILVAMVWNSGIISRIKAYSWDTDIRWAYKENGMAASILKYYKDNRVTKPEGYSVQAVERLSEEYDYAGSDVNTGERPDKIIMIMNESFSDMDQYNGELDIEDLEYFDQLRKECISGDLYVSVRGGGTCNTEFEALTGNSMAFLPDNCYPFTMYLKHPTFSLAEYFSNEDFEIAALHLENKNNWGRSDAYENMSLEPFYTIDDYPDFPTVRKRATDSYAYKCMEEIDDSMKADKKFILNVTLQNHGGYTDPMGMQTVFDLPDQESEYQPAELFFSLMKLSDDALKELIDHYSKDDEKTMIVFFGDHQPNLGSDSDEFLFPEGSDPLEKYNTPFIIWKNYGNEKKDIGSLSANYLPVIVLEEAGYELTPYLNLVKKASEEYPVITTQGVVDADGKYHEDVDEVIDDSEILKEYAIAEYNNIFDSNRVTSMFDLDH